MTLDTLVATLLVLRVGGLRWKLTPGFDIEAGARKGFVLSVATRATLATLRPERDRLTQLAQRGQCPGCDRHAMPPLAVCYWCRARLAPLVATLMPATDTQRIDAEVAA